MERQAGLALLLVAALTFASKYIPDSTPDASIEIETPTLDFEDDLREAFDGQAVAAQQWAGLLHALARYIEEDATTSDPLFATMFDVDRVLQSVLSTPIDPIWGGGVVGPKLADSLAAIGTGDESIDSDRRKQVVGVFLSAARALKGAR